VIQEAGIGPKGSFVFAQSIDLKVPLTQFLWHNSGSALFLSATHDNEPGPGFVHANEVGQSGRTTVPAPKTAAGYNHFMCGCDTADQKRAQGSVMTKTYKWYITPFHWLLDQGVMRALGVRKQGIQ